MLELCCAFSNTRNTYCAVPTMLNSPQATVSQHPAAVGSNSSSGSSSSSSRKTAPKKRRDHVLRQLWEAGLGCSANHRRAPPPPHGDVYTTGRGGLGGWLKPPFDPPQPLSMTDDHLQMLAPSAPFG